MPDKDFFDSWQFGVIIVTLLVSIIIWDRYDSKKKRERKQREADKFAAMPPDVQQLHIHAKNKIVEFNISLIAFLISAIAFCYLIYLNLK